MAASHPPLALPSALNESPSEKEGKYVGEEAPHGVFPPQ